MQNSTCVNIDGSYVCPCDDGFRGDGSGSGCVGKFCSVTNVIFCMNIFLPDEAGSEGNVEVQYSCLPIMSTSNLFSTGLA